MARHPIRTVSLGLDAIQIEGGLIAPEQVAKIAATERNARAAIDYDCPKGTNLGDEISRYFRIGQAHWQAYSRIEQPTTTQTAKFAHDLLTEAFGFTDLIGPTDRQQGTRRYRLAWEAKEGRVPIVVAPPVPAPGDGFAKALPEFGDGSEGRAKRSPVVLLQDWLNGNDAALWGLVFAGDRVRLMRDNASLTRPAWIEADLAAMFRDEMFADFTAWWLLTHASRFGAAGTPPSSSPLEQWREAGLSQGTAARDRLREGVERAIAELGQGLIEANADLHDGVATGRIALPALFEELLRTVYRLIFLAVAEDRDLLHGRAVPQGPRALYREGYSFGFWRDRSARRAAYDGHHDAWAGMLVTLGALEQGEVMLGLPPLGGLFARGGTPILNAARIPNKRFLSAIYSLGFISVESRQTRINWRDMKTEELGSVYESLLEIRPVLMPNGDFVLEGGAKGNARKTSGSYYTPDSLVETLLDSALDPVLERAEAEGEAAILNLKVIDPACGSGHFLLGAARRMAGRLARLRNPDAGRDDEQAALRDVVSRCIHGVDRNPMAVELAKVALWIESVSPGQPLGFLDANIRCGDALLGVFSLDALAEGIPDDAYKALTGDDKATANGLKKLNKAERDAGLLRLATQPEKLANAFQRFHAMPENTPREVAARASEYERIRHSPDWVAMRQACDTYVAAFILAKPALPSPQARPLVPTTRHIRDILSGGTMLRTGAVRGQLAAAIDGAAWGARAFHWPIEFPDVMVGRGGFDAVLGNPPWERIKLQEKEFFAGIYPEIAAARHSAARKKIIERLAQSPAGSFEHELVVAFETQKRIAEAAANFARVEAIAGGRFPLAGRGDINTYALFAELFSFLHCRSGYAGLIAPAGLATDLTTSAFFSNLVQTSSLSKVIGFENEEFIFPHIHNATKFCIYILGKSDNQKGTSFRFFLRNAAAIDDQEREFWLTSEQIAAVNPNTGTAPVFRSRSDAELAAKVHSRLPVLYSDDEGGNIWNIRFHAMFHMANDSNLFLDLANDSGDDLDVTSGSGLRRGSYLSLYEGKMFHQLNHRHGTYEGFNFKEGKLVKEVPPPSDQQLKDPSYEITARYWVPIDSVISRLNEAGWDREWVVGFRKITGATLYRTMISAILPLSGVGDSTPLIIFKKPDRMAAVLSGLFSSLVFDYFVRLKLGGTNLTYNYLKQVPAPPPSAYSEADLAFIVPRVLELTYTSQAMAPFARDLGYDGAPFGWDEDRRAQLRAELDGWYALAYGLNRDELRYVLDPKDVMGTDYPSETFRVLQKNETAKYGEYRTRRLVLAAYDALVADGMRIRVEGYR